MGNPILRVTDRTQILPGTTSTLITTVSEASVSGNDIFIIASAGTGTARVARYHWNGSNVTPDFTPSVIASIGDTVPGLSATFTNFTGFVSSDTGNVAFIGTFIDGGTRTGLFLHDGTSIHRLIDTTQTLDGKTVNSFMIGQDALASGSVSFYANFSDGTRGTYVAAVPEPCIVMIIGGLFAAFRCRSC